MSQSAIISLYICQPEAFVKLKNGIEEDSAHVESAWSCVNGPLEDMVSA